MANIVPNLTQVKLKQLQKLLSEYAAHIRGEQPLAAEVILMVCKWVSDDID